MKQIEADVIIEISATFEGFDTDGEIIPLWECDETYKSLCKTAAQYTLEFIERNGGGTATYKIHDFR